MAAIFHQWTNGLHTASKGITFDAVRVTDLDEAPGAAVACTIAEDCKAGLISQVIHSATGTYDFYLTKPYPPKLVTCEPSIDCAAANSALLRARYKQGSYDPTTGKFTILVSNATPAAADGSATDSLHVSLSFNRYKN